MNTQMMEFIHGMSRFEKKLYNLIRSILRILNYHLTLSLEFIILE